MPIRTISLGQIVNLDDAPWVVCEYTGLAVKLRDVDTGEYRLVALEELSEAVSAEIGTPSGRHPGELDLLTTEQIRKLRFLADHLDEMTTGIHPDRPGVFNPIYRPNRPIKDRESDKSAELDRLGYTISAASLHRKRLAYSPAPGVRSLVALLDGRTSRVRDPLAAIPDEFVRAIRAMLNDAADKTTTTSRIHRKEIVAWLARLYPDQTFEMPHANTLRKWVRLIDTNGHINATAKQRNSDSKRPPWMYQSRPAIMPGHEVQIDSSKFDILVRDENDNVHRATLVAMIDKRTRSVCASGVYDDSTKGFDLALLLARALAPRRARRARRHFAHVDTPKMPWVKNLSPEERSQYDDRVPFIYPQRLIVDNGADYRSHVFLSACERFGVDLSIAPPGSPTWKAVVENFFAIAMILFAEQIPGFIGGNVLDRAHTDPPVESLLTIDQLAELWDEWVTVVWQNRVHGGLMDPQNKKREMTPNKMYLASYAAASPVPLPITRDDYIALLPVQFRTVQPDGITIATRRYDSVGLAGMRGRQSGDVRNANRWAVRYDPLDPAAVWVQHPDTGAWVECDWLNQRWIGEPHQTFIRKQLRQIQQAVPVLDNDAASGMVAEALRGLRANVKHTQKLQRRRKRALEERTKSGMPTLRRNTRTETTSERASDGTAVDGDGYIEMGTFDPDGGI